ncbi:hypothetical protein ACVWR2_002434 [Salmonella enterica subsp. enterica serovar Derby]
MDNAKNNPLFFIALQQFSCHPKVASIRRKSKATACCYRADHHYEYGEFGNPIADRWGKAQCREHRFEWNGEHRLVRFTDVRQLCAPLVAL